MAKKRRRRKSATAIKIEFENKRNKRKYSRRYILLLNYVKARDSWQCQLHGCEKPKGVKLTVHHIVRHADSKVLRENKSNLISLCYKCHQKVTGQERRYAPILRTIVRKNEEAYRKHKKTKEELLEEQKKYQQLPDGFELYQYKTTEEVMKEKKKEAHLRHLYRLIRFRTQNKKSNSYKAYGGRGITMHKEWVDSYEAFEQYVLENLGECPDGYSIDRIENDKGYEPGNIRWASDDEQAQNRRTTVLDPAIVGVIIILHYKYKKKISEILDKLNLPNRTLISSVINFKTWKNIVIQYKSIITNEKVLELMDNYDE